MRHSRWAVVSGGLVCVLLAALAAMLAPSSAPAAVQADQTSDASLLELAQRYILRDGTGQVELLAGQMPGDLPVALALPAGSRLVGSVVRRTSARSTAWDIFFDLASTPDDVTAFFQRELQATGWAIPKPFDSTGTYIPSGFQYQGLSGTATRAPLPTRTPAPNGPKNVTLCPSSGDAGMMVSARVASNGLTIVTVHLDAVASQCTYLRRATSTATPAPPPLPVLSGPPDVRVFPLDYEDVDNNLSDATVETDMPAVELEALYGKQLAAAGWTRITGDARGPLAWSLWSTPSGKQGYLSVLEIAGQNVRDVHIQIDSISA